MMSSRSDTRQRDSVSGASGLKKKKKNRQQKLQAKRQRASVLEFENAAQSHNRSILELVKRSILLGHHGKAVAAKLPDAQRLPLSDQGNFANASVRSEAFECSTATKQLLRKSILQKQKEKMLRELQPKEKYANYLWRPW